MFFQAILIMMGTLITLENIDHINDLKAGLSAGVRVLGCLYGYSLDENNLNKLNYPYIRDISEIYSHINI